MANDFPVASRPFGQGKTLLLIMPTYAGISDMIIKNLEYYGFNVLFFEFKPFYYKNTPERLKNFFLRTILRDKYYKKRQVAKNLTQEVIDALPEGVMLDYALFIRADLYAIEMIQHIKKHAKHMVAYQWDGIGRYPEIFARIALFDKFFVFDEQDVHDYPQYSFDLTNNFYFDYEPPNIKLYQSPPTLYFIGGHTKNRVAPILNFLKTASQLPIKLNFLISHAIKPEEKALYSTYDVTFNSALVPYEQNLRYVQEADILVDFVIEEHAGLSLRFFDALYYQKKLITTNAEIRKYDFYHPDNIFVWDSVNLDKETLNQFIRLPYQPLPQEIVKKYAFGTWLAQILAP